MLQLEKDKLIQASCLVVRVGSIVNRVFLAAVVLGLLLSWVLSSLSASLLLQQSPATDVRSEMTGLRLMMLLGIVMAAAIECLFVELRKILESARVGDPFITANAQRLQTMGWALVVLQILDIPASLIERFFPSMGTGTPDPFFSIGGWMAVLLVFVLSRVFAAGSAMRDELEGTV